MKLEFKTLTSSASSASKLKCGTVHDRGWTKNLQLGGRSLGIQSPSDLHSCYGRAALVSSMLRTATI